MAKRHDSHSSNAKFNQVGCTFGCTYSGLQTDARARVHTVRNIITVTFRARVATLALAFSRPVSITRCTPQPVASAFQLAAFSALQHVFCPRFCLWCKRPVRSCVAQGSVFARMFAIK